MKKLIPITTAFIAMGVIGLAHAADLPNTKGAPVYAPPPAFSWTGFYIGANVGYDWGYDPVTDVDGWWYNPGTVGSRVYPQGITGGAQVGYNYQFAPVIVAGVEAEGGYISLHGSTDYCPFSACNAPLPDDYARVSGGAYGALTGKFGLTMDRVMLYAKGGVAFGDFQVSYASPGLAGGGPSNQVNVGWTAGAGVEYALTPNWSIKAEYDFYDLGNTTNYGVPINGYFCTNEVNGACRFQHSLTADKAVVGVNYRFDFLAPPGPVVAKY